MPAKCQDIVQFSCPEARFGFRSKSPLSLRAGPTQSKQNCSHAVKRCAWPADCPKTATCEVPITDDSHDATEAKSGVLLQSITGGLLRRALGKL